MKRALIILLCAFLLCLSLCSCKKEPENLSQTDSTVPEQTTQTTPQSSVFKAVIGYYSSDSLNPYKTKSRTNQCIAPLVYDSLFKLNENYEALPSLAESIELDGKKVTVSLRSGLSFSDGNAITASDVAYSFVLAKSSPLYSSRLSNVASCTDSADALIFTLSVPDVFVASCLDFPVIEKSSNSKGIPTGSGRYILKKQNKGHVLTASETSTSAEVMEQKEISLLDLGATENRIYLLRTGALSCFFDPDGKKSNQKTDAGVSKVMLNNLVFLGFNSENELLSDARVRRAIALLTDKDEISASAYDSMAQSAFCVFNPKFYAAQAFKTLETTADPVAAASLLEKCSLTLKSAASKVRLTKDGERASFNLIVNKEDSRRVKAAKLIKSRLEKGGLAVEVSALAFDDYKTALENGDFDLYLGEVKLSSNMDLSPFFSSAGKAKHGIDLKSPLCDAYFDFKEGKIDISTFESVFEEEMCFLPLCYRMGAVYYSRPLSFEGSPTESDIYSNIYSWSF